MDRARDLKLTGAIGETKTFICFKVRESTLSARLPQGWTLAPSQEPATRGANLKVVLSENLVALDASGRAPTVCRFAAIVADAMRDNGRDLQTTVIGSYIPGDTKNDPYGTASTPTIAVRRSVIAAPGEADVVSEDWEIATPEGDRIRLALDYVRGTAAFAQREFTIGPDAERSRIYRMEFGEDVIRSAATGIDRVRSIAFSASGKKLSPLFDGSEELLAVTTLPWSRREIWTRAGQSLAR